MARRKTRSRRRSKTFNLGVIETGTALSLITATDAAGAVSQGLGGDLKGAFSTLSSNIESNKGQIIGTLGVAAIAKMITAGRRPTLAKLGPIRLSL